MGFIWRAKGEDLFKSSLKISTKCSFCEEENKVCEAFTAHD